eukprot:COSAG03_NODE_14172_length_474_cov_0.680000_1_plen_74_part_10
MRLRPATSVGHQRRARLPLQLLLLGSTVYSAWGLPMERPVACVELATGHFRCGERVSAPIAVFRRLQETTPRTS